MDVVVLCIFARQVWKLLTACCRAKRTTQVLPLGGTVMCICMCGDPLLVFQDVCLGRGYFDNPLPPSLSFSLCTFFHLNEMIRSSPACCRKRSDDGPERMYKLPAMSFQDPFHLLSALCPHVAKRTYNNEKERVRCSTIGRYHWSLVLYSRAKSKCAEWLGTK